MPTVQSAKPNTPSQIQKHPKDRITKCYYTSFCQAPDFVAYLCNFWCEFSTLRKCGVFLRQTKSNAIVDVVDFDLYSGSVQNFHCAVCLILF